MGDSAKSKVNVASFLAERAKDSARVPAVRIPIVKKGEIAFADTPFSELELLVSSLAGRMATEGIHKGTRVLVLAKPGLQLIAGVFAILQVGGIPVVIDPGMGLSGFLRCVRHSEPEAVFGIRRGLILSRLFRGSFRKVRARLSTQLASRKAMAAMMIPRFPVVATAPEDPAAILFTSGSTGPAKGVCYEHGMFQAQIRAVRERFSIEPGEVDFPMLPVFALFNPALGMTTVVPPMDPSRPAKADAALQMQVMNEAGVTNSFGSPVLWNKIAEEGERSGTKIKSLRRILAAGAALSPALVERLRPIVPHAQIFSPYGATEALPLTAIEGEEIRSVAGETEKGNGVCVGRPLPGVEVRIIPVSPEVLTAADLVSLPAGEIGEIVASGPMVTRAYDRREDATKKAKVHEGDRIWHRMGDLGYWDKEGRLWFCGRVAERVTTADGVTFDPECCEQVFNRHPRVYRTALVGLGPKARRTPGIVVQPQSGEYPSSSEEMGQWIEELKKLAGQTPMTAPIRHFFFRKEFPVDVRHNAKIHRLQLAKEYAAHGLEPTE
ncbi:fatty acid CoA ligase family protein [Puniceicoccus vermicola]|uniref:AMP-binding protein n=1 Tax=Puniceicoccus vermicola TaxID=388746 RepID=A0A7X1AUX8_9BACT|nr:fatty acid CoA ligase family protein [Puniceicoccus vermicola]MBC2600402.1 AMP-binding protein [Puniceicoccus vermicola]